MLSVGGTRVLRFLSAQDDVADAAEDFAVVVQLRKTALHRDLREDFRAFVNQVISVSEQSARSGGRSGSVWRNSRSRVSMWNAC